METVRVNLLKFSILLVVSFVIQVSPFATHTASANDGEALLEAALKGNAIKVKKLLENGAEVNYQDKDGMTALIWMSSFGDEKIVKVLLDNGAKVHIQDKYGKTALMWASSIGDEGIVKVLLDKGADVNIQDKDGKTSLMLVLLVLQDAEGIVKVLLGNGANPDIQGKDGQTALMHASYDGDEGSVKVLLENGANINLQSNDGATALMHASYKGHEGIVKVLLENSANVNLKQKDGKTALSLAKNEKIAQLLKGSTEPMPTDQSPTSAANNGEDLINAALNGNTAKVRELLENGAEVNFQDRYGMTALMEASYNGHEGIVKALLENGSKVNIQDNYGWTALRGASYKGHEGVVKVLLENGAKVNIQDKNGETALMEASSEGHEVIVKVLLENGAKVNIQDKDGKTALYGASIFGREGVVKVLMGNGADVNLQGKLGLTALDVAETFRIAQLLKGSMEPKPAKPLLKESTEQSPRIAANDGKALIQAASFGDATKVKKLLEHGANVNFKRYDGRTALILASDKGHKEIVKALLENGAEVNNPDNAGMTALMLATINRNEAVVKTLMENGADANLQNEFGWTALRYAKTNKKIAQLLQGSTEALPINPLSLLANLDEALLNAAYDGNPTKLRKLLEMGAKVNYQDKDGKTALIWASEKGREEIVKVLLDKGANANLKPKDGKTALMYASWEGHEAVVKTLMENDTKVNIQDNNGFTALMLASFKDHEGIVKVLLENSANANLKQKEGKTALSFAKTKKIAQLLQGSTEPMPTDGFIKLIENGGILYKNGQYDKALENYEQALAIAQKLGNKEGIATVLNNIGWVYYSRSQYDKALQYYERALAITQKLGRKAFIAIGLDNIGQVYQSWGQNDKAIKYFERALAIDQKLENDAGIAIRLGNIGLVYQSRGQYDKAIEYYEQSLVIAQKLGMETEMAIVLNNIGGVYESWGKYDKAIVYYEQSLGIAQKLGRKVEIATALNNIGGVYQSWGQYDKAIEYYEQSLVIAQKLGREAIIATNLGNIGMVYQSWEKYGKAIEYLKQALVIAQKLGTEAGIAIRLNNIGLVYQSWGQYDKAIEYYEQSLIISQKLGTETGIAANLNNIGLVYYSWGKYDKAIVYYKRALAIDQKLGTEAGIATSLNNIGLVYKSLGKYGKAIAYLQKSVELIEKLRLTAKGDVRRDYLASQMGAYQVLISALVLNGAVPKAFEVMELSRAKLLAERLAKTDDAIKVPTIQDVQNTLRETGKDTAVLTYSNTDWEKNIQIAVTPDKVRGQEFLNASILGPVFKKYENSGQIAVIADNSRGMKKMLNPTITLEKRKSDLADLVLFYRKLLLNPSDENKGRVRELGKVFYQALIQPMEEMIKDKKHLIIIPDGVLGYLPFETLIDQNGRYLAERVHITYAPSFGILSLLKNRNYDAPRKPLLAFGGAVYDEIDHEAEQVQNEKQMAYLKKTTLTDMAERRPVRMAYASLGLDRWGNLPGTLEEVKGMALLMGGAKVFEKNDVTEARVKTLSKSGDLARYKVIHFATHGLAVPEFPELSALVLSQPKKGNAREDGYLRMGEVAELELKADFVNLSACETGLGKVYGGEGIVGLTQSFLISGANGVSASLWTVNDRSTMIFMVGVYQLVIEKGMSYYQAMTEMKRAFIKGEITADSYNPKTGKIKFSTSEPKPTKATFQSYSNPFYWAPFVYYGRN